MEPHNIKINSCNISSLWLFCCTHISAEQEHSESLAYLAEHWHRVGKWCYKTKTTLPCSTFTNAMAGKQEKLDSKTKMDAKGYTYNDIRSHVNNKWIKNTRIYIFEALLNFIELSRVWKKKGMFLSFNLFFTCSCMEYIIFPLNESWTDNWIQFKAEFQKHDLLID